MKDGRCKMTDDLRLVVKKRIAEVLDLRSALKAQLRVFYKIDVGATTRVAPMQKNNRVTPHLHFLLTRQFFNIQPEYPYVLVGLFAFYRFFLYLFRIYFQMIYQHVDSVLFFL